MHDYYALLGVESTADQATIEAAYQAQRERYSAERVAELGAEFRQIAEERTSALDAAYRVLSDPARRSAYDRTGQPPGRSGLSRRDLTLAGVGLVAGLALISLVWFFAGRAAPAELPPVATINRPAPALTLPQIDGQPLNLEDYRGKVVLVNFWYTDCPPCKEETPALQQAYAQLQDRGLVVLGVNVRQNERTGEPGVGDVRRFMEQYGMTYPVVLDETGAAGRAFQVLVLPTSFFIDQRGTIRFARFSTLNATEVEQIFEELTRELTA